MAAVGVSVLFGVGVTAAPSEERGKNRFRRGATIVSGQSYYAPSSPYVPPLLFQFRVKWSNRSMDRSTQKVGAGIFQVHKLVGGSFAGKENSLLNNFKVHGALVHGNVCCPPSRYT